MSEVFCVAGHEDEVIFEGCGGNEAVGHAQRLSLKLTGGTQNTPAIGYVLCHRQDSCCEERQEIDFQPMVEAVAPLPRGKQRHSFSQLANGDGA